MRIQGKNVDLIPFTQNILTHLFIWHDDPWFDDVMSAEVGPKSESDLKQMYNRFVAPIGRLFVVAEHDTTDPIGIVAFGNIDLMVRQAEVFGGIGVLDKRDKGYGIEALTMMIDWGVGQLGLQRIYAIVKQHNQVCINMLTNAGFKKGAVTKNALYQGGKFVNTVAMNYTLASSLPLNMFAQVSEFTKEYKQKGESVHSGHVKMLNAFCEYIRKTGGDE